MTKHTPGPWAENSCEIQAVDGSPICEMLARPEDSGVNYPHRPIADANSRLICAAPDLLNAIEHVLIASEDGGDMNDIDWDTLRRTVAKAKGVVVCEAFDELAEDSRPVFIDSKIFGYTKGGE